MPYRHNLLQMQMELENLKLKLIEPLSRMKWAKVLLLFFFYENRAVLFVLFLSISFLPLLLTASSVDDCIGLMDFTKWKIC